MKKFIFSLIVAVMASLWSPGAYAAAQESTETEQAGEEGRILELCKWYVAALPGDDDAQRRAAAAEILKYATETDAFTLTLPEAAAKFLSQSSDLLMVYIAGEVIYCLEHKVQHSDAASFAAAMDGVMELYARMPDHKVKSLNKYLGMAPEKRQAEFTKLYSK